MLAFAIDHVRPRLRSDLLACRPSALSDWQIRDYLIAHRVFTFEFPLVDGVVADPRLPAIDEIEVPMLDLTDLADLQGTVELLRVVGAID